MCMGSWNEVSRLLPEHLVLGGESGVKAVCTCGKFDLVFVTGLHLRLFKLAVLYYLIVIERGGPAGGGGRSLCGECLIEFIYLHVSRVAFVRLNINYLAWRALLNKALVHGFRGWPLVTGKGLAV